jgi:hypothetical protein
MRNDLVPRFSTAAVEAMQQELMEIDYKNLAHQDLMEHEVRTLACTVTVFLLLYLFFIVCYYLFIFSPDR